MQKFIPIALLAILIVGCKGGESTAATTGGGESTTTTGGSAPVGGGEVTLKLNPKQGDKFTYEVTANAMGNTNKSEIVMECTKVEGDKITMATTSGGMKIITVSDSTGKQLETKVEGAPAGTPAPENNNSLAFPAGPIKVGDTWTGTMKMQGSEVKLTYKLAKVDGNVATIESTMDGLPAGLTLDGPTVAEIDTTNGMPISTVAKMKMKGPDGKEMAISSEMRKK